MTREEHSKIFQEIGLFMKYKISKKLLNEQWNLIKRVAPHIKASDFRKEMITQWESFGKQKYLHQKASRN